MYAASFCKRVVNIPRSLCHVVGGVMSGALYLGGVMTVNHANYVMYLKPLFYHSIDVSLEAATFRSPKGGRLIEVGL